MISSVNAYSGVSSSLLLKLFDTASASSASSSGTAQPNSGDPPASSNDPAAAIQGILAESQIGGTLNMGGWSATNSAEAAYASQMAKSGAPSGNISVATAAQADQIDAAVAFINKIGLTQQFDLDPAKNNGASGWDPVFVVSSNNALTMTINSGIASLSAQSGASFPDGVPSVSVVQQQLASMKADVENCGFNGTDFDATDPKESADHWWNNSVSSTVTLIQLPDNATGGSGQTFTTFRDGGHVWALSLSDIFTG